MSPRRSALEELAWAQALETVRTVAAEEMWDDYSNADGTEWVACPGPGCTSHNYKVDHSIDSAEDFDVVKDCAIAKAKAEFAHEPGCAWVMARSMLEAEAAEAKLKLAFESGQRVGEEIRDDIERKKRQAADERAAGLTGTDVVASSIEDTRLLLSDILTFFYHSAPSSLMDNTIADSLARRIRTALTALTAMMERP